MATKKPNKKTGKVIGVTGTDIFSGIITEEYNAELSDVKGIKLYDKMRKSDATVRAALSACKLPIRRANWFIKPASEDEMDVEIADFVSRALFEEMSMPWDDFLRQGLLELDFGVMVFEKIFTIRDIDGQQRIIWKKFGPRLPKSITHWETATGEMGIQQQANTLSHPVSIPIEKLIIFVNEIEGDNWWGTSLLRAAYKHWYMKTNLERIDAVVHERQGLGIPSVKLPKNHSDEDVTKAKSVLKNLRAHDQGYLLEYEGVEVEFKDMKASGTKDASRAISYHNRQIVLSVLAQFLDLGSGSTGSRALSNDHSSLFLQSLEAIANSFADTMNKYAIRELVDLNFDGVERYPELDYNDISRVDINNLSTAYQRFAQSGAIKPTEGDDRYLRELMGLPEREEGEEIETPEDKEIDQTLEDLDLEKVKDKKKVDPSEIEKAIKDVLAEMDMAEKIDFASDALSKVKDAKKYRKVCSVATTVLSQELDNLTRKRFAEENNFKSWRKLTFAEKKVNFGRIQEQMDKLEGKLKEDTRELLNVAKDDYLKKMTRAIEKKDTKAMKELEIALTSEYTRKINKILKDAYTFAKNNAAREMGVKPPANNSDVVRSINILSDSIAGKHAKDVTNEAKNILTRNLAQGENVSATIGAMEAGIAKVVEKVTRDAASVVIAGHINLGRQTVFNKNMSSIYALQRSEILDQKTCNFCLSIDGRIVEKDDPITKVGTFHSNCRGIWVEILEEEEEKPSVSGIPQSLRDRVGDAVNELVQPKKPITKKNTPASKQAKKNEKK